MKKNGKKEKVVPELMRATNAAEKAYYYHKHPIKMPEDVAKKLKWVTRIQRG